MHSSAHTTTTVSIRLDASETFEHTGETYARGTIRTARIEHVSVFISDGSIPIVARIRGTGISKSGETLRIDREFEVEFRDIPAYIVGELHWQFDKSIRTHYQSQGSDPARAGWKLPAGSGRKFSR